MAGCLACELTEGKRDLPGGRIFATSHWVVEHCVGPLGIGTLIVKPFRHCAHVWDLTDEEAGELGALFRRVAQTIQSILEPDRVYVCLWSHASWKPGHIHFVLQPVWNRMQGQYERPGPSLQVAMLRRDEPPPRPEVEAFAAKARDLLLSGEPDFGGDSL